MSTSKDRDEHQLLRARGTIVGPQPPARQGAAHGRHVSRVAGMAVAVGFGMAVVSNAGVANADTGDSSKDSSSADSTSGSSTSSSHTTTSAQDSSAESTAKTGDEAGSTATAGSSEKQGGSASLSASAPTTGDDARDGAVQVSGGAVVTSRSSSTSSSVRQNSGSQTSGSASTQPKTDSTSSPSQSHRATATTESAAGSRSVEGYVRPDAGGHRSAAPTAASNVKAARQAENVAVQSTASAPAPTAAVPTAQPSEVSTASTAVEPLAVNVVTRAVAAVSSLVGLAPTAQNTPTAPQPTPALWTLLAGARRELDHVLDNHAPQLKYDPASDKQDANGVVSGDLDGVDPDGDPLSYKVVQGPPYGSVDVHADGTFTYTPTAALADSGGVDSFVVTVSDQTHALFPGLRNLVESLTGTSATHTTTATISVPVAAPTSGVMVVPDHVKRLDIVVDATYADLRARFEQAVPTASADLTALLASGTPDYDALVAATNASAPQGFIRYYSLDASRLTVWGYDPADTHSVQYLFGNPLVTEKLYKQNPSTLLATPLRAQIYEAPDGSVHLVVDDPSSGFDSFADPEIAALGVQQDESLAALLNYLNVPVPNELVHSATPAPVPSSPPEDTSFFGRLVQSVKHTFFNHAPSVGYDESQNSQGRNGVLTGALDGSDVDGDAVTYKVVQGPASGSVVVNADGTFTYTPSAGLANSGGTDSFVVALNDGADPLPSAIGSRLPASSAHITTKTINVAVHAPNAGVTVYSEDVNRLDIIVNDSYADLRAKFEAAAPTFSPQVLQILGAGKPNFDGLVAAIAANAPNGFIRFNTIETGALLKVAGEPASATNAVQYLVGNPVFAEQMYREDRSTQLYAPLRATIYQAANGTVHFVIDQPSTRFDSFDDPTIDGVGEFLDGKVANLLTVMGAPVPDVLTEDSA
jgi:uncharacterized protein (DUF302 family)